MAILPSQTYVYDEIHQADAFRYLVLQPGSGEDPLQCSLHTTHLDEAPLYEAISYVWGTDDSNRPIICDGKLLLITPNLSEVLRRVRLQDAPRTLWADSICINQVDRKEKGHQVAIMGQIYRLATRVLICMGVDSTDQGPRVQTLLEEVSGMINSEIEKLPPSSWDSFPHHRNVLFQDDARWWCLNALLNQEWFTRGWVVREAALGKESWVIWGRGEFSWKNLMLTMFWLRVRAWDTATRYVNHYYFTKAHMNAFSSQHIDEVQCFFHKRSWRMSPLLDYLGTGKKLRMTDPRDKIYAFLDMPTEEARRVRIEPTYDSTYMEVYHKFAASFIHAMRDHRILDHVVHDTQSLQSDTPSWVPDWNRPTIGFAFIYFQKLGSRSGLNHSPTLINDTILKTRGVILEPVQFVSDVFHRLTITPQILSDIWTEIQNQSLANPYQSVSSLRAFCSAILQVMFYISISVWEEEYTQYLATLSHAITHSHDHPSPLAPDPIHVDVKSILHGRKFILTPRGYMGLGPSITQEGDVCALLFGSTMPCILRRAEQHNTFKFIGQCSVLGAQPFVGDDGLLVYADMLGEEYSKEWVKWDVEERDIYIC